MSQDPISRAARAAQKHLEGARELPVTGPARAVDLERHLDAAYRFEAPIDADKVIDDVAAMLRRGAVHASHPAYFGMFDPSVLPSSVAASTLIAAFDPQAASWSHAPAALAMEQHALRWLAARLGYDPRASAAHFTSGGQEANTEAIVVALTHAFPEVRAGPVTGSSRAPSRCFCAARAARRIGSWLTRRGPRRSGTWGARSPRPAGR